MSDIDPGGRVDFDFDGALELARKLWALADQVSQEEQGRQRDATTALAKWAGPHATRFAERRGAEFQSSMNVWTGLRENAQAWAAAWVDAMEQQNKNNRAAAVQQHRDDRSWIHEQWDEHGFGEDDSESQVAAAERPPTPTPPSFTPTASLQDF